MLDHAYQVAIHKYKILRINEITPIHKREHIYGQKGDYRGGEKITAENVT